MLGNPILKLYDKVALLYKKRPSSRIISRNEGRFFSYISLSSTLLQAPPPSLNHCNEKQKQSRYLQ